MSPAYTCQRCSGALVSQCFDQPKGLTYDPKTQKFASCGIASCRTCSNATAAATCVKCEDAFIASSDGKSCIKCADENCQLCP